MKQESQLYHEELTSRGVIRLRGKDMYSVWVKPDGCNLTSGHLRKIADITEKYARRYLLFTTNQNAVIPFVNLKDVEEVIEELSEVYLRLDRCGPTVRNIKVCYDDKICPEAVTNCISLAEKLDNFFDVIPARNKTKIGVAGCQQDCITSRVLTDIGFVGVERDSSKGYDVFVGGKLGLTPFVGVKMAECLTEEESVRFLQNYFDLMNSEGRPAERSADLIRRLGVERVRQKLNKNLQEGVALKPIEYETRLKEKETDKMILGIRATLGQVTSTQLRKIADIAEEYGKGFVHCAVRGYPEIPCIDERHLEDIRQELQEVGMPVLDKGIDNIQGCCFGRHCTENVMNPHPLLRRIGKKVEELGLNNLNIKVSASGCPNSCGIHQLSDIGFWGMVEPEIDTTECDGCELCVPICRTKAITMEDSLAIIDLEECKHCGQCIVACPLDAIVEKRKGFAVLVGGRDGEDVRLGELIAEFLSEEEALQVAEGCLRILKDKKANAATIIDEVGIEKFKEMLVPSIK